MENTRTAESCFIHATKRSMWLLTDMRGFLSFVLGLVILASAGCQEVLNPAEIFTVTFKDKLGQELATGAVTLARPLSVEGEIAGHFVLQMKHPVTVTPENTWFYKLFGDRTDGRLDGSVSPPSATDPAWPPYHINFMPGVSDANVSVSAKPTSAKQIDGTWSYDLFAGGFTGGSFVATRK